MSTSTQEEIRIGDLTIRPRLEGGESGGTVAIHEFDVPAGSGLPLPHRHDAYEETIYWSRRNGDVHDRRHPDRRRAR